MGLGSAIRYIGEEVFEVGSGIVAGILGHSLVSDKASVRIGHTVGATLAKEKEIEREKVREVLSILGDRVIHLRGLLQEANRLGFIKDSDGKRWREDDVVELVSFMSPDDLEKRKQAYLQLEGYLEAGNRQGFFGELDLLSKNSGQQKIAVALDVVKTLANKAKPLGERLIEAAETAITQPRIEAANTTALRAKIVRNRGWRGLFKC